MRVIGIDPAPTKQTAVYDGERFTFWDVLDVPARVADLARSHLDLLVAWDAPLGLDPGPSRFYGRRVDRAAKRLNDRWVADRRVERKVIGVADAASCPHNLLTQAALGLPVGGPHAPWQLVETAQPLPAAGRWLVEVHPAVALGAWWGRAHAARALQAWRWQARSGGSRDADRPGGLAATRPRVPRGRPLELHG